MFCYLTLTWGDGNGKHPEWIMNCLFIESIGGFWVRASGFQHGGPFRINMRNFTVWIELNKNQFNAVDNSNDWQVEFFCVTCHFQPPLTHSLLAFFHFQVLQISPQEWQNPRPKYLILFMTKKKYLILLF